MTENISLSATTVTQTLDPVISNSQSASQGKVERADKPIPRQAAPDVAITEVASEAALGKKESLDSINEITTELRDAISTLNAALEKTKTRALITRDEEINRFIVRIADEDSGEIVREIPSEAILKFSRNLQELKGLIFDESL